MPGQPTFMQVIYAGGVADGTAVTAAAETALVPDYTLPAGIMRPGDRLKYVLFGRMSTVITTPGTWTWQLRWGGVGGTSLASSGAIVPDPTAASTNVAWRVEFNMVIRTIGLTGTAITWGQLWHNDIDDGAAAVGNLQTALSNQMAVFPNAAAAVTIDTTTSKALTPTITPSVATGSITCHDWYLESKV